LGKLREEWAIICKRCKVNGTILETELVRRVNEVLDMYGEEDMTLEERNLLNNLLSRFRQEHAVAPSTDKAIKDLKRSIRGVANGRKRAAKPRDEDVQWN